MGQSGAEGAREPVLLVRLPNYVGDVVLTLPALRHLEQMGHRLVLVGKPWARELLRPMRDAGWAVHAYPKGLRARLQFLRALRADAFGGARRPLGLSFPNGLSSALECRLAGFRTVGHAKEGRSPLLMTAVPLDPTAHEMDAFARLAFVLTGRPFAPAAIEPIWRQPYYRPDAQAEAAAEARIARVMGGHGWLMLSPFSGGKTFQGQPKEWPDFARFAQALSDMGHRIMVCPGTPAERAQAQALYGHCSVQEDVDLPELAALMRRARLVVANDTGPGHLAAAAGARLLTVAGPGLPAKYVPRGPHVRLLQPAGGWPTLAQVHAEVSARLPAPAPVPAPGGSTPA